MEQWLKGREVVMIGSILGLFSVSQLLSFYNSLGAAGPAIVVAAIGASTWLFQRFAAYFASEWEKATSQFRFAMGLQAQISALTKSYRREFVGEKKTCQHDQAKEIEKRKAKWIAEIEEMHPQAGILDPKPLILVSSGNDPIYEDLKKNLLNLSPAITSPVVAFFSQDALFDASYDALGTPQFVAATAKKKKELVDNVFIDAEVTAELGESAVQAIDNYAWWFNLKRYVFYGLLIATALGALVTASSLISEQLEQSKKTALAILPSPVPLSFSAKP